MMEYKKLGDIATYVNGYAFKPEQRGKKGLPIIRIQDLTGNSYDLGYYEGDYPKKIELNNGTLKWADLMKNTEGSDITEVSSFNVVEQNFHEYRKWLP